MDLGLICFGLLVMVSAVIMQIIVRPYDKQNLMGDYSMIMIGSVGFILFMLGFMGKYFA